MTSDSVAMKSLYIEFTSFSFADVSFFCFLGELAERFFAALNNCFEYLFPAADCFFFFIVLDLLRI